MTFSSPSTGDMVKFENLVGHLLIVRPIEFVEEIQTSNGPREAIRADVVDLTANDDQGNWGVVYRGSLLFGRVIVPGLRRQIGELVLGRVGQGLAKSGQKPAWQLVDAVGDAQAVAAGQEWLRRHPQFEQGGPVVSSPAAPAPPVTAEAPVAASLPVTIPAAAAATPAFPAIPLPNTTGTQTFPAPGQAVTVPPGANPWDTLSDAQRQALASLGFTPPS